MEGDERVTAPRILLYSSPVFGVFVPNVLISFYLLKFSTDVLLIAPATIGFLLMVAKFWDAVTDPATGWLSDRTQTPMGRRRPWFLAASLPFGLSTVMLWSPPESLAGLPLSLWMGAAILFFYTAFTVFRVPHMALGAELSRGYHDRTRVFGITQMVEQIAMFGAAGALMLLESSDNPRDLAKSLSLAMGAIATLLILLAAWRLEEREEFQGRGGKRPFAAFRDVLTNPHSRLLIGVFFLEQLGFGTLVALVPYASDYILETPGRTAFYLFSAIASALLSIPLWIRLSLRYGKKEVWVCSLTAKILVFAACFTLSAGDFQFMLVASVLVGFFNGCGSVIGSSLKADVVDWDEARTGERKEGAYFATWNFVQKLAGGVSIWLIGLVLSGTGFVPNEAQGEGARLGILVLCSIVPAAFHLVAVAMLTRFSLDQEEHRKVMQEAEERCS